MKDLVLVGGGHAHLTAMLAIDRYVARGFRVTVVNPDPYHYYSGMGPGMLAGTYHPEEIRFHVQRLVEDRGGRFHHGRVVRIDPGSRTLHCQDESRVTYDAVSFNVGSDIPYGDISPTTPDVYPVKPIVRLRDARERIRELTSGGNRVRAVVVGGGAAGLEMAGAVWRLVRDLGGEPAVTLAAGKAFLSRFHPKVARLARASLTRRAIEILEGARVAACDEGTATLTDGRERPYDIAFLATGVRPPALFRDSGLPVGPDGGLLVNDALQSVVHPEIFGGGDCIAFEPHPLDKVGVYAVRENPILAHNPAAVLDGASLQRLTNTGPYLLIFNLGNGRGIFWRNSIVFESRLAFHLKDYIDRRFMRNFQVSGERGDA